MAGMPWEISAVCRPFYIPAVVFVLYKNNEKDMIR